MSAGARLWSGRIIKALVVLFLLFDSVIHIMNVPPVVAAFAQLGYPDSIAVPIGIVELVCIVLFVLPWTSVLGALLLTAYLGGATAAQVRIGGPYTFSIFVGVLLWIGVCLLDDRVYCVLRPRTTDRYR